MFRTALQKYAIFSNSATDFRNPSLQDDYYAKMNNALNFFAVSTYVMFKSGIIPFSYLKIATLRVA